jgi:hypothetical protein
MRTIHVRLLSSAVLALATVTAQAAAQTTSPAVVNRLEVQRLVAREEPGDNARLAAHFAALAERYTAEAKRHAAMSNAFGGNPNRQVAAMNAHCTRLAELNTRSAATVRELAAHHERLAAGSPSTAPGDSAPYHAGKGAPAPTDRELKALAGKARTPADHRALEEYFLTLAKEYSADADDHAAMAQAYRGNPNRRGGDPAVNCDRLVMLSRDSVKEANAAAAMHRDLAGIAR